MLLANESPSKFAVDHLHVFDDSLFFEVNHYSTTPRLPRVFVDYFKLSFSGPRCN